MLKLLYKLLVRLEMWLLKLPQSHVHRSASCYGEQLIALANPDPRSPQLVAHNNNSPLFGGGWCALRGIAVNIPGFCGVPVLHFAKPEYPEVPKGFGV